MSSSSAASPSRRDRGHASARSCSASASMTIRPAPLRYVGDVGTGFTSQEIDRLWRILEPLSADGPAARDVPAPLARRVHWVEPRLVVQVRYTEMTDEGRLRHPAYLGVREDKSTLTMDRDRARGRKRQPARENQRVQETIARLPRAPERRGARRSRAPPVALSIRQGSWNNWRRSRHRRKDGRITLPDGDTLDVTNLQQGLLARHQPDQGRPAALLRAASRRSSCRSSTTGRW